MTSAKTAVDKPVDAIDILTADHKKVKQLFKDFAQLKGSGPTPAKTALVTEICMELTVHATIEEALFYPAARNAIQNEEMIDQAEVEHESAKYLISQLLNMQAGEPRYEAKVTVLKEYIKHHINEEENELFPKIKQAKLDLPALGRQLMERKAQLQEQLKPPGELLAFVSK